jgi:two-component sensor histidine kinase
MKRILLLTFFILASSLLFSQQAKIDSLKNVLNSTRNNSKRVSILKELCKKSSEINSLEKTQKYYDELLNIASEKNDYAALVFGYHLLLREYEKKRDSLKALEYFNKAHQLNLKNKDSLGIAKDYNALGGIYNKFQLYEKAEEAYNKALAICKNNNFDYIGKIFINLGIVNQNQNEYNTSTEYALLAQENALKTKNKEQESSALGIIAGNYMWLDDEKKAEEYYRKALKISEEERYSLTTLNNYRGLALTFSRSGNFDKALEYNFKSLKLLNDYGDKLYKLDVLLNIASTYSRKGNTSKAYEYYDTALIMANELNTQVGMNTIRINVSLLKVNEGKYEDAKKMLFETLNDTIDKNLLPETSERSVYILLSMAYEGEKEFQKSLLYHKKYFRLAYDILSKSQIENVAELNTQYQTEKKEKENLILKQQNAQQALLTEKEKTQKWAIGGGLAVSLAGLGIFFIAFNKNKKQKRKIEKQKNEIEKLQRELHHRLKNNLAFIDFFITLAKGKFPDPAYRQKLDELKNRINSMFEVHKQLFKKEDITSVNARTYISALVENVKKAYVSKTIAIRENIVETDLKVDISFPIGLIVNEFVTNSCKYAFTDTENGSIYIELDEDANNYKLKLSDNGKGLPADFDINTLTTFGMETIKLLTQEYKGTFTLDGSKGTSMDITFPKNAA